MSKSKRIAYAAIVAAVPLAAVAAAPAARSIFAPGMDARLATALVADAVQDLAEREGALFAADLSGDQLVPPVQHPAQAQIAFHFDPGLTKAEITFEYRDMVGGLGAADLYVGRPGDTRGRLLLSLFGEGPCGTPDPTITAAVVECTLTNADMKDFQAPCDACGGRGATISNIAGLADAMDRELIYVNASNQRLDVDIRGQIGLGWEIHRGACATRDLGDGMTFHSAGCTVIKL